MILAIDTCLGACSAAVLDGGFPRAARSEAMERGHQERLAPLAAEVMKAAGVRFEELDRIGVTVGPGSFTGLRVGLAFAKGLGLALGKPVVGVNTLLALAASTGSFGETMTAAVVDARRGQVYLQAFEQGDALGEAEAITAEDAIVRLLGWSRFPWTLIGSGSPLLADGLEGATVHSRPAPRPETVARLAELATPEPVRPLYLRAPDAKPPA